MSRRIEGGRDRGEGAREWDGVRGGRDGGVGVSEGVGWMDERTGR